LAFEFAGNCLLRGVTILIRAREALRLLLMPNGEKAITYFNTVSKFTSSMPKFALPILKPLNLELPDGDIPG
jgi:hypothetical protein